MIYFTVTTDGYHEITWTASHGQTWKPDKVYNERARVRGNRRVVYVGRFLNYRVNKGLRAVRLCCHNSVSYLATGVADASYYGHEACNAATTWIYKYVAKRMQLWRLWKCVRQSSAYVKYYLITYRHLSKCNVCMFVITSITKTGQQTRWPLLSISDGYGNLTYRRAHQTLFIFHCPKQVTLLHLTVLSYNIENHTNRNIFKTLNNLFQNQITQLQRNEFIHTVNKK